MDITNPLGHSLRGDYLNSCGILLASIKDETGHLKLLIDMSPCDHSLLHEVSAYEDNNRVVIQPDSPQESRADPSAIPLDP